MGRLLSQIFLLTKKNFILQIRRPVGALVELLLPCIFLGLISLTRLSLPVVPHCFSLFDPLPPGKLLENNPTLAIIAMAPNNAQTLSLAQCLAEKSNDYLPGFVLKQYSAEEINNVIKYDISDPKAIIELLKILGNDYRQIALMPTLTILENSLSANPSMFAGAIEISVKDSVYNYSLGFPPALARRGHWFNERDYPPYYRPGPGTFKGYDQGWVALQQAIDRCILSEEIGDDQIPIFATRQMPYPKWREDGFSNAIRNSLPLMIVISFLWIAASISKEIVGEKASRMKETMKMMGLSNWVLWLSWVIQRVVLMLLTVFLMVLVMKLASYVIATDPIILYIFLFEYAVSVMCFCFFLSTLFSKSTTSIAGTMLLYFILYVPYFFTASEFDDMSNSVRYLTCLLSSTCMGYGASIISKWETMEEGLQFSNVGRQTSDLDTFTMGDVMLMLFVDIIIYSLMTWYVEAVFPGEFGIKQKPWFFLTRDYWFGSRPKIEEKQNGTTVIENSYNVEEGKDGVEPEANGYGMEDLSGEHEKNPRDKAAGISIRGLVKRFNTPKGKMTAVDGLSLDMYTDQITSLLGHNGAGKTTTMSMLTGLYAPSGGDALVNGHSILSAMDRVRDSLGICPQHNVLFDRLTVQEHLDFFIKLKGYDGDIPAEIKKMIQMLKLTDKSDSKADELSGGMKRKLSVGIAFVGASKIVILDEPTAGMDPYARRATWDLILENKKDRTILLTTHYMDEADFLGDRVAIMATGRLMCSGSSMFLKRKYGVGYHLTLVKTAGCDVHHVDQFIKGHVSTAQKISDVGSELVYILPDDEIDNFVPLFKKLEDQDEKQEEQKEIESFGLSLTTLEEVFMKVGESEEDKNGEAIAKKEHEKKDLTREASVQFKVFKPEELNSGVALFFQQLLAMITKRYINTKRYKKGIIVQIVLPVIFAVLALLVVKTVPAQGVQPSRRISLSNYPGAGEVGTVFTAQLAGYPDPFPTAEEVAYLETLNLEAESLVAAYQQEKDNVSGITEFGDCCKQPALQLAPTCYEEGAVRAEWGTCDGAAYEEEWGYKDCYDGCFTPPEKDGDGNLITCGQRPEINAKYADDELSFFANAFLAQIKGDVRFYRKKQIAITASKPSAEVTVLEDAKDDEPGGPRKITGYDKATADYTLGSYSTTEPQKMLTTWYSHEGLHLAPGVTNAVSNMVLEKHSKAAKIEVTNKPMPESLVDKFTNAQYGVGATSLSILMLLGFSFLTSSFVLFVVEERENKSKHLQQISGVNGIVYWLGTFTWDLLNYTACIVLIVILFAIFDIEGYKGAESLGGLFILLFMYGFCAIPFVYMVSLAFSSPVSAYAIVVTFTFITGLAGSIANIVLGITGDDFQPTLEKILLILPNFCFINGLVGISANEVQKNILAECEKILSQDMCVNQLNLKTVSVFDIDAGIGKELIALLTVAAASIIFVLVNEIYGKTLSLFLHHQRSRTVDSTVIPAGEDDDVKAERTRVLCEMQNLAKQDAVVISNLRKEYGKTVAVQNLTLDIPKNQCFGLLGVNGAGKTTTFSMLTGDVSLTAGEAYIAGYNLRTDIRKIQQRIGYCPQFDALIGIMTGRELLRMFANLRGIPSSEIEQTVAEAIRNLNLDKHADKLCGSYSGGNKRKLSTAIALVGNPDVLFLDEPTAGMDPTARRFLWTVLADLTSANIGTSIVLTTHSMEECEALCNRLVIMVNGAFRCLGSIQHLKNKYGDGYTITMTMSEDKQADCADFIDLTFPGAILKEDHLGYLHYELKADVKWSVIFEKMEQNKVQLEIEDYAVNQTSLEQVFLNFAKDQNTEDDGKKKKSRSCCCCGNKPSVADTEGDLRKNSRVSVNRGTSLRHASYSGGARRGSERV